MIKVAIAYDFDGTLAKGNLPEYGLLQELQIDPADFWKEVKEHTREHDADEVMVYMQLLLKKFKDKGIELTRERFKKYAENIQFFNGVTTWFSRINEFAKDND